MLKHFKPLQFKQIYGQIKHKIIFLLNDVANIVLSINQSIIRFVLRHSTPVLMAHGPVYIVC